MPTLDLTDEQVAEIKKLIDHADASASVRAAMKEGVRHSRSRDDIAAEFAELSETWKRDTIFLSKASKKAIHPAYQRIIGMGEGVVPLILEELKRDHADWFWALAAITGQDPVPASAAGDVAQMAQAWLRWGRARGYEV